MAYKPGILLGQITKTSGFEGAVLVKIEKKFIDNIPEIESVFLEIEGKPVPFFISWSEYQGADVIKLAFDGYDSVKKTGEFRGCNVFLTTLPEAEYHEDDAEFLNSFTLLNRQNKMIGTVSETVDNAGQILMTVKPVKGSDILIPLHEDLIIEIDKKKKILRMDLPEGLTGLNS